MPVGIGSGLFAYVGPVGEVNLATNPSYEFNSTGAVAIQSATLGTTSQFQRYGAWSLKVTPNSNGTSGAILGTWTTGNGTTYDCSVWAFVEQGVPMRRGESDSRLSRLYGQRLMAVVRRASLYRGSGGPAQRGAAKDQRQ